MAIKPKELEQLQLTEEEEQKVRRIENEIDATLRERFIPEVRTEVKIEFPKGVLYGDRVYNRIEKMYQKAGWDIEYKPYEGVLSLPGEPRVEGNLTESLIFTPRRQR